MSNPKIITKTFTIIKNGIDPNLEIIRDDRTGFYNVTKIAKLLVDKKIINSNKYACKWFVNQSTENLMNECRRIIKDDLVRYELKKDTPTEFAGTYVHELLYDHFLMWLDPVYALRISAILRAYHKEVIRVVTTQIQLCSTLDYSTLANVLRYQGYCFECFYINNPDDPIIGNYKIKENTIMNSIAKAIPEYIIRDKIISGSGCRRRPDGLIQLAEDNHNIVIEIDEHQHKGYGYVDEDRRIYDIYNALNQQALTVIRFNPDSFNGMRNGLFSKPDASRLIDIADHDRYTQSINKLIEVIQHAIETPPLDPESIVEIKLRFDHED